MKKLFLVLIAFVGILSFANNNSGNSGTGNNTPKDSTIYAKIVMSNSSKPKKGQITLNPKDSTANYFKSDSTLLWMADNDDNLPAGYKPKEWKR